MCFGVKQWGESPLKNSKNLKPNIVYLSYVKIYIKKMVRESVSKYTSSLVKPPGSASAVFQSSMLQQFCW